MAESCAAASSRNVKNDSFRFLGFRLCTKSCSRTVESCPSKQGMSLAHFDSYFWRCQGDVLAAAVYLDPKDHLHSLPSWNRLLFPENLEPSNRYQAFSSPLRGISIHYIKQNIIRCCFVFLPKILYLHLVEFWKHRLHSIVRWTTAQKHSPSACKILIFLLADRGVIVDRFSIVQLCEYVFHVIGCWFHGTRPNMRPKCAIRYCGVFFLDTMLLANCCCESRYCFLLGSFLPLPDEVDIWKLYPQWKKSECNQCKNYDMCSSAIHLQCFIYQTVFQGDKLSSTQSQKAHVKWKREMVS